MRRRDFITFFGGTMAGRPLAARAQQPVMPVIGFLDADPPEAINAALSDFGRGLKDAGYIEGRLAIVSRWGDTQIMPQLARELVQLQVALTLQSAE